MKTPEPNPKSARRRALAASQRANKGIHLEKLSHPRFFTFSPFEGMMRANTRIW